MNYLRLRLGYDFKKLVFVFIRLLIVYINLRFKSIGYSLIMQVFDY